MSEPIVLEGRLREAGDGYECSDLYLDDKTLRALLEASVPSKGYVDHWVAGPPYEEDDCELKAWTRVTQKQVERMLGGEGPNFSLLALFGDYGRVRITIERLGEDNSD